MRYLLVVIALFVMAACSAQEEEVLEPITTTTTTLPALTADNLVAALPGPLELPTGWTSDGQLPTTAFDIEGAGFCGERNGDQRALDVGATAVVKARGLRGVPGQGLGIAIWAFPTAEQAVLYMDATAAAVKGCPSGTTYTGEPETFFGGDETLYSPEVEGRSSLGALTVPGADQAFLSQGNETFTVSQRGTDYGYDVAQVAGYARAGEVVITLRSQGTTRIFGFGDADEQALFTPSIADVESPINAVFPEMVRKLNERLVPFWATTTTAGG
jgi:hypothetical protein